MAFFDDLVRKLFPRQPSPYRPLVNEQLVRSERFLEQYAAWHTSARADEQRRAISRAYHFKKTNINQSPTVHLLQSAYANGFAVTYDADHFDPAEFKYLADFFRDQVRGMGYRQVDRTRRIMEKAHFVEETEKYYLKPPFCTDPNALCDQLYGNVLIEWVGVDNKPSYLKVVVSVYSDSLYTKALPFEDFITALFND